ncbi:hypothetical protein LFZ47_18660 [Salmonella enterica subsp. salamae serovar 55:k:z39 str. 1315K]|uniref:Uncharacterized protein n=1 Tax=Salmonella enterica subsp. salamae serovar 55:k:z39 str. 1315K TaxID=1243602 RepID=A0A6C7CEK7_SALER|nr:hypothetical protein LFZ47_18660 [Salmonella enterica subsp. salamae serovar 55:k:z39 str. 1315K]HCL5254103.1 hypothetical protein [Salmonella enterica]
MGNRPVLIEDKNNELLILIARILNAWRYLQKWFFCPKKDFIDNAFAISGLLDREMLQEKD